MKKKSGSQTSEMARMLARIHPHLEQVSNLRRGKRGADAHDVSPEVGDMRVHAANWIGAHAHAHRHLATRVTLAAAPKAKKSTGEEKGSALLLVQLKSGKLKHPPHPPKHVLISRTTGMIRGEQG